MALRAERGGHGECIQEEPLGTMALNFTISSGRVMRRYQLFLPEDAVNTSL